MKKSAALFLFLFLLQGVSAWAAQYDIKQMTPQIEQALANRQSRYDELRTLKAANRIGENSRGYVEALDKSAALADLVHAENSDRRVIYNAIVEQNGLGPAGMGAVETAFAEVQRDKAKSGDSIQLPSGQWTQK